MEIDYQLTTISHIPLQVKLGNLYLFQSLAILQYIWHMRLVLQTGDTILPFIRCFGIFWKEKCYEKKKSDQFFLITESPLRAIGMESVLI